MLAFAGGDSRIETSTLTKDQKSLHTAKVNELRNMDKFCVVEVVDRPQSQQVLSTRWVSEQRLDGSYKVRLVARGFEQTLGSYTDFTLKRRSSRLCAHFSRLQQFTEIQLLLEIVTVHFTNHRCHLNQSRCMWNQHLKHSWEQESFSGPQDLSSGLGYSQHTENQRHELQPVDIRSFYVCEETCTTIRGFDPTASHA